MSIIAVVVLYQNNGERQGIQLGTENYAQIMAVVEEYILENLSDAYRESLDEDDYLVIMSSKDERNMVRLVIDIDAMTVIGHIPSV